MAERLFPHLLLKDPPHAQPFTTTSGGGQPRAIPPRTNPRQHSDYLRRRLEEAWHEAEDELAVYHTARAGIYLEIKGEPGYELATKSLDDMRSRQIRLLNVRTAEETVQNLNTKEPESKQVVYATVYIAKDEVDKFTKKLVEYAEKERDSGKPYHADFVNSISDLRKALLVESFWTDSGASIPSDVPEWCEVWLRIEDKSAIGRFEQLLQQQQIEVRPGILQFPERAVKVIRANRSQLAQLTRLSDDIAEYRLAKDTAAFWIDLPNRDQAEWVENLLDRLDADADTEISICLLDTGVNNGHPLLAPLLHDDDRHCVHPEWQTHDHHKHGTLMAGVAGYGDLIRCLQSNAPIKLAHRLESVKILPPSGQTGRDLWGYITAQAISLAEIQAPSRNRIICMAVTARETREYGRPSSWSGALDQLASGAEDGLQRLLVVSAGNVPDVLTAKNYPNAQLTDSVHDPAQAWNALTVGAYTELDTVISPTFSGYKPVAPRGGLSPYSTTSVTWEDSWPIKPEIVMEGGNLAHDGHGFASECDDLALLSTFYKPQVSYFYPFNMTSAATAQAAWLAAQIQATYPDLWPETVRALMVHSAEWPDTLRQQFCKSDAKSAIKQLLRICGYGVPNLNRALYSAANSLTLIAQAELQPFDRKESGGYKTNEMHLYDLPWPIAALQGLPADVEVRMRVTLSYFIEPGPGEIGWRDRYRYPSYGLRFDLNAPGESPAEFVQRINKAARDADEGRPATQSPSDHWMIGSQARNKGSIHSDIWQGTPAELASSNQIAITPLIGWWRERAHLGKWNQRARYALVVSITTPEENIDLYTPVAAKIGIPTPVPVDVTAR